MRLVSYSIFNKLTSVLATREIRIHFNAGGGFETRFFISLSNHMKTKCDYDFDCIICSLFFFPTSSPKFPSQKLWPIPWRWVLRQKILWKMPQNAYFESMHPSNVMKLYTGLYLYDNFKLWPIVIIFYHLQGQWHLTMSMPHISVIEQYNYSNYRHL